MESSELFRGPEVDRTSASPLRVVGRRIALVQSAPIALIGASLGVQLGEHLQKLRNTFTSANAHFRSFLFPFSLEHFLRYGSIRNTGTADSLRTHAPKHVSERYIKLLNDRQ